MCLVYDFVSSRGYISSSRSVVIMDDDWLPDGECYHTVVYEPQEAEEPCVVYDHNGNAWVRPKIKLGFDLTVSTKK